MNEDCLAEICWQVTGYFGFGFGFGLVRMYHTTSTISHVRAELMNPTVIH